MHMVGGCVSACVRARKGHEHFSVKQRGAQRKRFGNHCLRLSHQHNIIFLLSEVISKKGFSSFFLVFHLVNLQKIYKHFKKLKNHKDVNH